MCVITIKLGCLHWLACAAGSGDFLCIFTSRRTAPLRETVRRKNLSPKFGHHFLTDNAVLRERSNACFPPRQARFSTSYNLNETEIGNGNCNYQCGEKIAKLIIFELKLAISLLSYLRFSEKLIPRVFQLS